MNAIVMAAKSGDGNFVLGLLLIGGLVAYVVAGWRKADRNRAAEAIRDKMLVGNGANGVALKRHRGWGYLGGNERHANSIRDVALVFAPKCIGVESKEEIIFVIRRDDIQSVEIETEEEMQSRVTATRLLLVGVFAFAWKQRTGGSILVTFDTLDGPCIFECRGSTKAAVLAQIGPEIIGIPRGPIEPIAKDDAQMQLFGQSDQHDARLIRLANLHKQGLISDAEYADKRQHIIDDL